MIYEAFLRHQVIFFRDQSLTAGQLKNLAMKFGELEPVHPFFPHVIEEPQVTVIETSRGSPPGVSYWHTDLSWQEIPSKCSLLHAQHLPKIGGDTIWVSMTEPLSDLPADDYELIKNTYSTHQLYAFVGSRYDSGDDVWGSMIEKKSLQFPPVNHPTLNRHPETDKEGLFINEQFTRKINGFSESDSDKLLDRLFEFVKRPERQVRFQWQVNSLAIWDNRCTQHYAVTDYEDAPRKMHRVTVKGDKLKAANKKNLT